MKIANPFERFGITQADYDGNENYGKFVIEPLERGFGLTIGNALRRVLLSALPGASMYAIEVEGARHEFTALEGVEEDVTTIILNLKDLILKIDADEEGNKRLEVNVTGPAVVKASDIVCPTGVTVVNPDLEIAHLCEGGSLKMSLHVRNGRGYFTGEKNKILHPNLAAGVIATDSNYSPVTKANYFVDATRVGHDSVLLSVSKAVNYLYGELYQNVVSKMLIMSIMQQSIFPLWKNLKMAQQLIQL